MDIYIFLNRLLFFLQIHALGGLGSDTYFVSFLRVKINHPYILNYIRMNLENGHNLGAVIHCLLFKLFHNSRILKRLRVEFKHFYT